MGKLKSQRIIIRPEGKIKGGELFYSVDTEAGTFTYQGLVTAGWLFFSKEFPFDGLYNVDPELLISKNRFVGEKLVIGPIAITVTSIKDGFASCRVQLEGEVVADGHAVLDLSQEHISLRSLNAKGTVSGYEVTLIANAIT